MCWRGLTAVLIAIGVLGSAQAVPTASAGDLTWNTNDFWEYSWSDTDEGLTVNGTLVMTVDYSTSDTYQMRLSGSGTISGTFLAMVVGGSVNITGSITREKSDFATMSTAFIENMSMKMMGLTFSGMVAGSIMEATPPLNDMPINQNLVPGTVIWSNTTVATESWFLWPGISNQTDNRSSLEVLQLVVGANESVDTPAGSFVCTKITASSFTGTDLDYYYSEKVGNYVKIRGTGSATAGIGSLGDLTLISYSHGSTSIMSFITGEYWWITMLIIVVSIAAVAGRLMMNRRGRRPEMATQAPTQQTDPTPPPQP